MFNRDSKVHNFANSLFFFLGIIRSGLLAKIGGSVCMSTSHMSLCVSFFRIDAELSKYDLFAWSNSNFCISPSASPFPTQSCLVLYYFSANLLHSLIMWLIVSSLSPHNLHLLFSCVLSIISFIWLVLMALFCAVIRRDSIFLLRFPFLCHVQVFLCEMLFISRLKSPSIFFSSHFHFLVIVILLVFVLSVSFMVADMSPPSCFSM